MDKDWMRSQCRLANESGLAMAVVLLFLVLILLMGTTLIGSSVTENQAASMVAGMKLALSAAEMGIQETMYRMRLDPATLSDEGDTAYSATADPVVIGKQGTPDTTWADPTNANFWHYNPSWSYTAGGGYGGGTPGNFLGGNAGNLDIAGRTFTSSGSSHTASGSLVNASLANGASYTVTVAPVVGLVGGCWQYVDQRGAPLGSCSPPVAPNPMLKVTSTGTSRSAQKTLSTMIQRYKINPKLDGALTANSSVSIQSASAVIDGHNFDCNGNNPSDTGSVKAVTVPSGSTPSVNKPQNLQCTAGTGITKCAGTSTPFPSTIAAYLLGPNAATADINALNEYLDSVKVAPANAPATAFHGLVYVTGDYAQPPDGSSGVLIVHNATSTATLGNFNGGTFKGLIIADQLQINGTTQVIGGITTFGTVASGQGNPSVKYSSCVVAGLPQNFPFEVVRGTWREQ